MGILLARRTAPAGGQFQAHRTPAEFATPELLIMKRAADANPVVGTNPFPRPAWRPAMSEFQRRALEHAEHRSDVGQGKPVVPQHAEERPKSGAPETERARIYFDHPVPQRFRLHCPSLVRLLARCKRVIFG